MPKKGKVWTAVAAFAVLIVVYEVGKLTARTGKEVERLTHADVKSDEVARRGESNTWQKITARYSPRGRQSVASTDPRRAVWKAELPTGPFGSDIQALEKLANAGNADAAFALSNGFRNCQFFEPLKDDAETGRRAEEKAVFQLGILDQIVDQTKEAAAKQGKKVENVPEISSQQVYEANLRDVQEQVRQCSGIDTNLAKQWIKWQKLAAELGDTDAELSYWRSVVQAADVRSLDELIEDKQVASTALEDSFLRGDSRALIAVGAVLEDGVFSEPDPYLAYAYLFAASQVPSADIDTLPWVGRNLFERIGSGSSTQSYIKRLMDRAAANLSPTQQLDAQSLGIDLFRQCCQGLPHGT
jgi:hypothetical protein